MPSHNAVIATDRRIGQPPATRRPVYRLVVGWVLLFAFAVGVALMGDYRAHVRLFQVAWLVGFVGFALVVVHLSRGGAVGASAWWWVGFVALRVIVWGAPPSDDLHRYMWEGKIQWYGLNPYSVAPDDPRTADLRRGDANWRLMNHKDYPAIYPPLAQMVFRAGALLGDSVRIAKAIFLALDVVVIVLIWRWLSATGLPPAWSAVYAACPLTVTMFAVDGHLDSLMLVWIAAGLLAARYQRVYLLAGCVGLAIASKLVAVVLLPWLFWRHRWAGMLAVLVAAATYLPYLGAGSELLVGLQRFAGTTSIFGLIHGPVQAWLGDTWSRPVCGGLLVAVCGWLATRRLAFDDYARSAFSALLVLMPVVHVWYLSWLLPVNCRRLRVWNLVFCASMVFYFESERIRFMTGQWRMPEWAAYATFAPVVVAVAVEYAIRRGVPERIERSADPNTDSPDA